MRKILDKMFENKKLSILIPILVSASFYLLFIIFGVAEDKTDIIIGTPIATVSWFFGVFFVIYVQIKNKRCPEGLLNFAEFAATLFFGISSVVHAILVVTSGFQTFNPITSAVLLTYASIAWAHSKRTKL